METKTSGAMRYACCALRVPGTKNIVLSLVVVAAIVVLGAQWATSGSHGYCEREKKNYTDEEFIRAALTSDAVFMFKLRDPNKVLDHALINRLVTQYIMKNPDCCKVFRTPQGDNLKGVSWLLWRDNVVVMIRDQKSLDAFRRGTKPTFDVGLRYVAVDNCLAGADVIPEITPGG